MGLFSKKDHAGDGQFHEPIPAQQAPPMQYNDAPHGHHSTRHSTDASPRKRGFLSRRRASSVSSSDEERMARNDPRMQNGAHPNHMHDGRHHDDGYAHGQQPIDNNRKSGGMMGNLLGRNRNNNDMDDPSIVAARERVHMAEQAEADAERALLHARETVADAKQHVRNLEIEAQEDERRARVKAEQAKELGKLGGKLGRKFY
jgi:hypothetical protein